MRLRVLSDAVKVHDPGSDIARLARAGVAVALGVGSMVGAGIFALIGEIMSVAGNRAPLSFLVAGLVAGGREWIDRVWMYLKIFGACPGPMDAWLVLRGVKTLPCRMEVHARNAMALAVGRETARILFIPAHTRGHIAYVFEDSNAVFCGDTLFAAGCGRLFEGTAQQMQASLARLRAMPDDTRVFCAHEYTHSNLRFASAVDVRRWLVVVASLVAVACGDTSAPDAGPDAGGAEDDAGADAGCVAIDSNDPKNPAVEVKLKGRGVDDTPTVDGPDIDLMPAALDFGQVAVGSSKARSACRRYVPACNTCMSTSRATMTAVVSPRPWPLRI